jgi:hypothetical protein
LTKGVRSGTFHVAASERGLPPEVPTSGISTSTAAVVELPTFEGFFVQNPSLRLSGPFIPTRASGGIAKKIVTAPWKAASLAPGIHRWGTDIRCGDLNQADLSRLQGAEPYPALALKLKRRGTALTGRVTDLVKCQSDDIVATVVRIIPSRNLDE